MSEAAGVASAAGLKIQTSMVVTIIVVLALMLSLNHQQAEKLPLEHVAGLYQSDMAAVADVYYNAQMYTDGRYEITSPVFDRVEFRLDPAYAAGGSFVIEARDNSPENIYIQSATLNGKKYDKCYLTHDDLAAGGTLVLQMGAKPSDWGKD